MAVAEDIDAPRRRAYRPWLIVVAIGLAGLATLWLVRKPVAEGVINRTLASYGVPATYEIADLGLGRQRLTNLVIGDPARPDLVADWVEVNPRYGLGIPGLAAIRAGHVRVRARLVNGTLSLGALDKLMPAPSGKPFTLPKLQLDVEDARVRLETPQGLVALKMAGRGRLDDGFSGSLAAVSEGLTLGGCTAHRAIAALSVKISAARPAINGPVRVAALECGAARMLGLGMDLDVALNDALDSWKGEAELLTAGAGHPLARTDSLRGKIGFEGNAADTRGFLKLDSSRFASAEASGARLGIVGRYRAGAQWAFEGTADGDRVALSSARLATLARLRGSGAGTPVGPLIDQLVRAGMAAGRSISGYARIAASNDGPVKVSQIVISSISGLNAAINNADISYDWRGGPSRLSGALAMGGGGFPALDATLSQAAPGGPITGTAALRQPYVAGGASLSFTPVRFSATPGGNSRFATQLTLSGPLGDGRLERLTMPVAGLWNGKGRLLLNAACTSLSWDRLAVSGLVLRPATLSLCPVEGALVRLDGGRVGGGASMGNVRLSGQLGSSPLTLAAASARIATSGVAATGLAVRLGAPGRVTRLDLGDLHGTIANGSVSGDFAKAGGQIGNVPLVLSDASGRWGLNGGRLAVTGNLTVSDAAATARFVPMAAREVKFALANGAIAATAALYAPAANVKVADLALRHGLSSGAGSADLDVTGLTFTKDFQPTALTPITLGVIADVAGTIRGQGHIAWNGQAVTSTGAFRTDGTDLAAAFGPVTGIKGEVRFTDLLGLVSAPGQVAMVAMVNPGIPVSDGTVRYQLLSGSRIQVDGARWPFAGGELLLEPTLLDFGQQVPRHMTFRVAGLDAAQFLQQFDFGNLSATGSFDGVLPMTFDEKGGRIEGGHLTVREGGGSIAYVGELTQRDLSTWGNIAFQALKALRYRSVAIDMDGPLAGEMVTQVRFAGVSQGEGTKSNFLIRRLTKLPFVFNVTIRAPFRQLIDSARSFYDPKRLIQLNLPALLEEQNKRASPPVQPPESEKVR